MDDELNIIRLNLSNRMVDLCHSLGYVKPVRNGDRMRYGTNGKFCVVVQGPDAGCWIDYSLDEGGHVFDLIEHCNNMDFPAAVKWAKQWLGGSIVLDIKRSPPSKDKAEQDTKMRDIALRVWGESVSIKGTLGQDYLKGRGITLLPVVDVIRFNPKVMYVEYEGDKKIYGYAPAIILLVRDIKTNQPIAIQRRYLSPEGGKHRLFSKSMSLGSTRGGAVMLTDRLYGQEKPAEWGLNLLEGFEDGLSAMQLGFINTWIVMGTSGISKFPVLDEFQWLRVISDPDQVGIDKAEECLARWSDAGKRTQRRTPPDGMDVNKFLIRKGRK